MQDVDDIYIYFQTYAYAGAATAAQDEATSDEWAQVDAGLSPDVQVTTTGVQAGSKPMPQPDAVFYGQVKRDGTVLETGTLTAILPRGDTISVEIGAITGTDYNYALPIPLATYDAGDTNYAANSARIGETIRFTVDGVPAVLQDSGGTHFQAYPVGAAGPLYSITVDISGPGSYPPGDVNVSGKRDSADALMVLKYDVRLIQGVTTWPPGPNTVYLPLCDVTEDGRCNGTDALRILMCDVGLAECGPASAAGAATGVESGAGVEPAPPVFFRTEEQVTPTDSSTQLTVRVLAESPYSPLGAALLDVHFDPARLKPVSCVENPAGRMDLTACNTAYADGVVRYTSITTGGIVEVAPLFEVNFDVLDPTVLDAVAGGQRVTALAPEAAFDVNLQPLRPVSGAPAAPGQMDKKLFLPVIVVGPLPTTPTLDPETTERAVDMP
jgi:hypothetical protein